MPDEPPQTPPEAFHRRDHILILAARLDELHDRIKAGEARIKELEQKLAECEARAANQ
jgi:hypothetical protein